MKKLAGFFVLASILFGHVYGQAENFLIYDEETGYFANPRLILFAAVENEKITGYLLCNDNDPNFNIQLLPHSLSRFREAFYKFLEWEDIASSNNFLEIFERDIPITVSSYFVTWNSYSNAEQRRIEYTMTEYEDTGSIMTISFKFIWNPSSIETKYNAILSIKSNTVHSGIQGETFTFQRYSMDRDSINSFLSNTTDENIKVRIEQGREVEQERERQRQILNELFR